MAPTPRSVSWQPAVNGYRRQKVWDPIIRVWHWALVCSVSIGWGLGEFRDFNTVEWHIYAGYVTASLLICRLLWGLVGPQPVRLRSLLPARRMLMEHLSSIKLRQPSGVAGHNPLGAISVIALLLLLSIQVVTGLFAEDDSLFASGPFAYLLPSHNIVTMTAIHHYCSRAIITLVGLHVAAIFFYLTWKRENLITPMFTGWKWVRRPASESDSETH